MAMDVMFGSGGSRPQDGVPDMTVLSDLDEDAINQNLMVRYKNDRIYTYSGTILIAVNPYKELDIYSEEWIRRYQNRRIMEEEPHVFSLAESSLKALQATEKNQSCVISGESGAGKTETTKFLLQYLCSVTTGVSAWVEQQILEANTILEAFGNAKTVRNDNSSRFGKFMQVCFDSNWYIKGCLMQDYLLEQSRITFQGKEERNYHVFYQLISAGEQNPELAQQYSLAPASSLKYLNQSGCIEIDGVNDSSRFDSLRLAFNVLHIPEQICDGIFKTLSAILWLGNLEFTDLDGEKCELTSDDKKIIETVAVLLGLTPEQLEATVLQRQINIRGTVTHIPFKITEARENRHAMAKALYSRSFAWLVDHINKCTNPGQDQKRFLGVLDIFGFENFATNSFEQLCINYTNEKLHKFFNHYVFALEQEIYRQEDIKFSHIKFTDNSVCLELLEKPPTCILKFISEECRMPKGTDKSYLRKLHQEFENHPNYIKGDDRRKWENEFTVIHYAGQVVYNVNGFVDKNRDAQQDVFFDLMTKSKSDFIIQLTRYQDLLGCTVNRMGTISRGSTKGKPTVSDAFRSQLQALVDVLECTNPWYVRCIKPNQTKNANSYDDKLVLDQLRYLGMNDIIRIRREGFPIHVPFIDFVKRYFCLWHRRRYKDIRMHVTDMLKAMKLPSKDWQVGKKKIFMRQKIYDTLEDRRYTLSTKAAIVIQTRYRMHKARKEYMRKRNAAIIIQSKYKSSTQRRAFLKYRMAVITIQAFVRGMFAREVAHALREIRKIEEEEVRRLKAEEEQRLKMENAQKEESDQAALDDAENQLKEHANTLSTMAQSLNAYMDKDKSDSNQKPTDTDVDLDTIFEFLTNVNANDKHPLEETLMDMDDLASKVEEEIMSLPNDDEDTSMSQMSDNTLPPPPISSELYSITSSSHDNEDRSTPVDSVSQVQSLSIDTEAEKTEVTKTAKEPIYETIPAGVRSSTPREPSYVSGPPPEGPPPAPPEQPIKVATQLPPAQFVDTKVSTENAKIRASEHVRKICATVPNEDERSERRMQRVERKLLERVEEEKPSDELKLFDMIEFAEDNFNDHEKTPEGTIISTLRKKSTASLDMIPRHELLTFTKSTAIPTSHIKLNDPENVTIACNIFRDLSKYSRGDIRPENEAGIIQNIIEYGLERDELRNEIYVQCMRQATNNPNTTSLERIWLLLCLCIVAFHPSKALSKYFTSFLHKSLDLDGRLNQYVQWCIENNKNNRGACRKLPPSSVEIAAMKKLGTIVCRFFFLDGRTKAIDIHPRDTSGDAMRKLADRLGLANLEGWAIYESHNTGDKHVKIHEYLYDIISAWEKKQNKSTSTASTKKGQSSNSGENRFVFKKRLFRSPREIPSDPAEVNLLFSQAVYSVVREDDYPINEKVALQLAGLQSQVSLGDPQRGKTEFYAEVNSYLPERIADTRKSAEWVPILAEAHRQYGTGKTEILAKVWYLTCVMQFPLYGTTMYRVSYRGYWSHGNTLILGINCDGISIINPENKVILYEYRYCEIESVFVDPSDDFITFNLLRTLPDTHKCFVFETKEKEEIGFLIASYSPLLASWIRDIDATKKVKRITSEDRVRLYYNIVHSRRQIIDQDLLKKPIDQGGNIIVSTLRRLNKQKMEKLRQDYGESAESYKGFHHTFWAFTKVPLTQTITKIEDSETEAKAMQIFLLILTYSGLNPISDSKITSDDQQLAIIQSLLEQCMKNDPLLNETYLQLLKQTNDHPDPNSRVNMRHWSLLTLFCSVIPPTDRSVRKYLRAHLQKCSIDYISEEGKYARFAEKCLLKALNNRRRQWPPSKQEILCTINRRPIYARFHFMDGQFHSLEFDASATSADVLELIKVKIGLKDTAKGYAIYEMLGATERCLNKEEVLADVMSRWDKYRQTAASNSVANSHHIFLFKKHLLVEDWIDLTDLVEKELLYFQVLYSLRADKFPVTNTEAVMLCALRAQIELGNFVGESMDYTEVIEHTLSPRLLNAVTHDAVAMQHQSLFNMDGQNAKQSFLTLIKSFPLHRATIFDVTQSFTSNWPKVLWLALDEIGVHLLEHRSRNVLCTYEYSYILNFSASVTALMIITGTKRKQSKIILNTTQAFMIATLIRDYSEVRLKDQNQRDSLHLSAGGARF